MNDQEKSKNRGPPPGPREPHISLNNNNGVSLPLSSTFVSRVPFLYFFSFIYRQYPHRPALGHCLRLCS